MYRLLVSFLAIILLSVAVLGTHLALAQAAEEQSSDEAESTAETTTEVGSNIKGAEGAEVFIPTEEISEDFAVSFPVDI